MAVNEVVKGRTKHSRIRASVYFFCTLSLIASASIFLIQDTGSLQLSLRSVSKLTTLPQSIATHPATLHREPILVVGILSLFVQRDEFILNISSNFKGIQDGSSKIFFVRCMGIDENTTTMSTNAWTVFVNCSSERRDFELCDKSLGWLRFAAEAYPNAMFLAKSDADSYIHVDKLLTFMQNLSWMWPSHPIYVGRGMQIFVNLHNGMCFGPVPFMGGMIEIFSPRLIPELQCSYSVVGGMGEDFVLGHSLMHTKVQHTMVSCDECFHDKEVPLSTNSMVVHGFKKGSELKLLDVAHQLNSTKNKVPDYKVVTYNSHSNITAPFHRWGGDCSNSCVSVVALIPGNVGRLQALLQTLKAPIVAFDFGLPSEDFEKFSFQWRGKVDTQQFPEKDPTQEMITSRVSRLYNTTCLTWINI